MVLADPQAMENAKNTTFDQIKTSFGPKRSESFAMIKKNATYLLALSYWHRCGSIAAPLKVRRYAIMSHCDFCNSLNSSEIVSKAVLTMVISSEETKRQSQSLIL